jgi:hypothetical protein
VACAVLIEQCATSGAETGAGEVGALAAGTSEERSRLSGQRSVEGDVGRIAHRRQVDAEEGGESSGLEGVELAHAAGHEEALDEAEQGGNARPEEEQVEDAETGAAQVEVVRAEAAEKESEEYAGDLVAANGLKLLVEDGLRIGIVVNAHDDDSLRGWKYAG